MKPSLVWPIAFAVTAAFFSSSPKAEEHPTEHPIPSTQPAAEEPLIPLAPLPMDNIRTPKKKLQPSKEHPAEHPTQDRRAAKRSVTIGDVVREVRKYVRQDARLKGGYFLMYDKQARKALPLTLTRIHRERLAAVRRDLYFVCADFKTPKGDIYDLDLFVRGHHRNLLRVISITIHKENDQPRYTWAQDKGRWKQISLPPP